MEAIYRYVLGDVDRGLWTDSWSVSEDALPLGAGCCWQVTKRTLRGGTQDGVDIVEVDNGALSFTIVPTRGMGVWKGSYRGMAMGWDSPVRDPVHPSLVEASDRGGLGWLKGFNEWIVRCGLDSNGAPGVDVVVDNNGNPAEVFVPLHGKIANSPARYIEVRISPRPPHQITVVGVVDETMLFGPALRLETAISTTLGSNALTVVDRVTNLNRKPAELELLYHCNYGPPLLESGSTLVAPYKVVCPRDARAAEGFDTVDSFSGPRSGYVEQCYFYELVGRPRTRQTSVLLKNREGSLGSSLHFSLDDLPCFTLWKNTAAKEDGYVIGMEPATNYPNPKSFERESGRVIVLDGGETRRIELTVAAHTTRRGVREAERAIRQIQKGAKPRASCKVLKRLSPSG